MRPLCWTTIMFWTQHVDIFLYTFKVNIYRLAAFAAQLVIFNKVIHVQGVYFLLQMRPSCESWKIFYGFAHYPTTNLYIEH